MKTTIKQLRQVIQETLKEMKLGIANSSPSSRDFGRPEEKDDEMHTSNLKDLRRLIMTVTTTAFNAPQVGLDNQKWNLSHGVDHDWDNLEDDDEVLNIAGAGADEEDEEVINVSGPGREDEKGRLNFENCDRELTPDEQKRIRSKRAKSEDRPIDWSIEANREEYPLDESEKKK